MIKIARKDTIIVQTETTFCFTDRIRILLGRKFRIRLEIDVELPEPGQIAKPRTIASVEALFPRRGPVAVEAPAEPGSR